MMVRTEPIYDPPPVFLADPRFFIQAIGSWREGGIVRVHFSKELITAIKMAAAEWTALALLIEAGKESEKTHWERAFMTSERLARLLQERAHRGTGSAGDIHRSIYRVRELLGSSSAARLQPLSNVDATSWAKLLVEIHPPLGYRLSLPPSQLQLVLRVGRP